MTNPKKRLQLFIIITVALLVGGTAGIQNEPITLKGLTVYEGVLQVITMKYIDNEMHKNEAGRNIVAFTLEGLDMKFGIYDQLERYENYFAKMHVGDTLKVYYNTSWITPEGYNLGVGQIEKNGVALIDLAEQRKENNLVAYAIITVGFIFLSISCWYYLTKVRGSRKVS